METRREDIMKGVSYWTEQIERAGLRGNLREFNDILTGHDAPSDGREPVIRDVVFDGIRVDIYHSDNEPGDSGHRLYIHLKERVES